MKGVGVVGCPKMDEVHYGVPVNPGLLRNCAVCFFYGGETKTHIYCIYPIIKTLKKYYESEINVDYEEWDQDAMEIPNSLMEAEK